MKRVLLTLAIFSLCSLGFAESVYKVEKIGEDLYRLSYSEKMKSTKGKDVLVETKSVERTEKQIRDSYDKAIETKVKLDQLVEDLQFAIKQLKKLED